MLDYYHFGGYGLIFIHKLPENENLLVTLNQTEEI